MKTWIIDEMIEEFRTLADSMPFVVIGDIGGYVVMRDGKPMIQSKYPGCRNN